MEISAFIPSVKELQKKLFTKDDLMPSFAAAGAGILTPYLLRKYENQLPTSPLIPIVGNQWGRWCVAVPVGIGGAALAVGAIKRSAPGFVLGITMLVSGIINALSNQSAARYPQQRLMSRPQTITRLPQCSSVTARQRANMGRGLHALRVPGTGYVPPVGKTVIGRSETRQAKTDDRKIIRA